MTGSSSKRTMIAGNAVKWAKCCMNAFVVDVVGGDGD